MFVSGLRNRIENSVKTRVTSDLKVRVEDRHLRLVFDEQSESCPLQVVGVGPH